MDIPTTLDALKDKAKVDRELRDKLLATRDSKTPVSDFCKISTEVGLPMYEMDLIGYGEESYAAMRRSTNGGGENSPLLQYEDDLYTLFLEEIAML